jgi:hypothetical protein
MGGLEKFSNNKCNFSYNIKILCGSKLMVKYEEYLGQMLNKKATTKQNLYSKKNLNP